MPHADASSLRGRLMLCAAAVVVVVATAIGAYFWPTSAADNQPVAASATGPLELPTEPAEVTVEELREEGERVVADLLKKYPQSSAAHKTAAMYYQSVNQFERIVEHWERCVALNPQDVAAYGWLVKAQLDQGDDQSAARTIEAAKTAGVQSAELYLQSALVEQRRGRLPESERVAQQGLQSHREFVDLWIALGQAQMQQNRLTEAKASFEAALRIKSDSMAAHSGAANVCQRLGETESAEAHRQQVETLHEQVRRNGLQYNEQFFQTLQLTVATVLSSAATLHDEHGNSSEAERLCQRAYTIHPGYPDSYRQLVNIYHRDGKAARAIVVQRRLTQVEQENDVNHLNLASLLFEAGQMKEGEGVLLAASRAAPQKAIFPQTLAAIYLRSGQVDRARQFAEHATRLEPTPERQRLLAEVCRRQGDLVAADAALEAANAPAVGERPGPARHP